MRKNTRLLLFALLAIALAGVAGCRSSRSNRSTASRNKTTPPAASPEVGSPTTSAKAVLGHADSALQRVSQLATENREDRPAPERPDMNPSRTPWGAPAEQPFAPQPNLTEYGLYEAALGAYNGSRYEEAIGLFSQIVSAGRPPELVPNAYYWMGESFYALGRYAESMPYFEYVTRVGPQYKREMALYKLSRANLHLGNRQGGNLYYERLRNEYPHSSHIATLRKLGAR